MTKTSFSTVQLCRRSVSFSEAIESCEPRILDKSSYADYLNCWYSYKDHKYFKKSVMELADLLMTYPNLGNDGPNSTLFRGVERHTLMEKTRIKEKREISYSIVASLQSLSSTHMAKMLRSQSDDCLLEAYDRALEDEKNSLVRKCNSQKDPASPTTSSRRRQPQYASRPEIVRSF